MELLVQFEELVHVDSRLGLRCQIGAQRSEVLVRARRDCIFQRCGFDCLPDELGIGNTVGVDPRDEGAELWEDLNQTLFGQEDQAFANGCAAHGHLLGEVVLRQRATRGERQRHDAQA